LTCVKREIKKIITGGFHVDDKLLHYHMIFHISEAVVLKEILASSQDYHHKPGMRSRKKNVAKNNLPTDSSLLNYAYIDGSKNESSASHPWLHQSLWSSMQGCYSETTATEARNRDTLLCRRRRRAGKDRKIEEKDGTRF